MTLALWHRCRLAVQELGWPLALLKALHRLLQRLHASSGLVCYCFLAQPVPAADRLRAPQGRQYAFALLTRTDPALAALGRPPEVIAQRFAQGAMCLLATRGVQLAGCLWFVRDRYQEDEVRVDYRIASDCVWDFDVYVAPSERLGYLFARQWDVGHALLRQSGTRYSLSRIHVFNRQSLAAHRRLGAQVRGWALFAHLGQRQLMLSSLWPFVALGGRPCLRLSGAGHVVAPPDRQAPHRSR